MRKSSAELLGCEREGSACWSNRTQTTCPYRHGIHWLVLEAEPTPETDMKTLPQRKEVKGLPAGGANPGVGEIAVFPASIHASSVSRDAAKLEHQRARWNTST